MITGNSRWPLLRLNESAANAQSWAITITPKMLTQTKNGKAIDSARHGGRSQNSSRLPAKNAVTAMSSRSPSRRRRTAVYVGTSSISSSAISATA